MNDFIAFAFSWQLSCGFLITVVLSILLLKVLTEAEKVRAGFGRTALTALALIFVPPLIAWPFGCIPCLGTIIFILVYLIIGRLLVTALLPVEDERKAWMIWLVFLVMYWCLLYIFRYMFG